MNPLLKNESIPRRYFLGAAVAAGISTPLWQTNGGIQLSNRKNLSSEQRGRIQSLELLTAAPLADMEAFYRTVLEFETELNENKNLKVIGGETEITFRPAKDGKPFYHFAFNVPENKILSARNWLVERTELIPTPQHMIDRNFPEDIRHFRHWNAHAVFFWDPAGNILELIARHDLKNSAAGEFRSKEIQYASEIAFITEDVNKTAAEIQDQFSLPQYGDGSDAFRAIGDETGLLLVFRKGRRADAKKGHKKQWDIFPMGARIHNEVQWKDHRYQHSIRTS